MNKPEEELQADFYPVRAAENPFATLDPSYARSLAAKLGARKKADPFAAAAELGEPLELRSEALGQAQSLL